MIPVPIDSIAKINGAAVISIGVTTQTSIDQFGDRYTKRGTTRGVSFLSPFWKSINQRTYRYFLKPCVYEHYLLRLLHTIHSMRFYRPDLVILLVKYDLDLVCMRLHVMARMAILAITILKYLAYILLRLVFGVAIESSDYCTTSELIIDLTNDILRDRS